MKNKRYEVELLPDPRRVTLPEAWAVKDECVYCHDTRVCPYCHNADGNGCPECGRTGKCPWCYAL